MANQGAKKRKEENERRIRLLQQLIGGANVRSCSVGLQYLLVTLGADCGSLTANQTHVRNKLFTHVDNCGEGTVPGNSTPVHAGPSTSNIRMQHLYFFAPLSKLPFEWCAQLLSASSS